MFGSLSRGFSVLVAASLLLAGCGTDRPSAGGLGQPCRSGNGCDAPYVCLDGLCVAPADAEGGLGQPCRPDGTCEEPYLCEDEVCVEPAEERGGLGQPCHPDETCDGSYVCEDGVCTEEACVPQCEDVECGPDTCGGECPPGCEEGWVCDAGSCVEEEWTPQCEEGMCLVPGGPFMMGCNVDVDDECAGSEHPYREVTVAVFEIDMNHVTVAEYADCVGAGACDAPEPWDGCNSAHAERQDHPMNCVDWLHATEYCEWAGKRLCTEAEWEKAARGTDGRKHPWGNEPVTCQHAVFNELGGSGGHGCGAGTTWPVGSKPAGASPYGVLDMVGNIWDWVEDDYGSYEDAPTDGSAHVEDPRGYDRVVRGGAWYNGASHQRASARSTERWADTDGSHGFRCCR